MYNSCGKRLYFYENPGISEITAIMTVISEIPLFWDDMKN
jgi:hypothetical protein